MDHGKSAAQGFVEMSFRSSLVPGTIYQCNGYNPCGAGEGTVVWLRTKEDVREKRTYLMHFVPKVLVVPSGFVHFTMPMPGEMVFEEATGFDDSSFAGSPMGPLERARHEGHANHRLARDQRATIL